MGNFTTKDSTGNNTWVSVTDAKDPKYEGQKVVTNGVVAVSGVAAPGTFIPPAYTPVSGATPGKLSFVMANNTTAGFGTGEFVTVTCDIAAGFNPKATDFTLADFQPVDLNAAPVSGLTASAAATIN